MLDWLRFFPITLRYSNQPVTPKGPYLPWMLKHKWQFQDSYFHFRCPLTNRVAGDPGIFRKSSSPGGGDITRFSYHNGGLALSTTQGRWSHEHFFSRTWLFVGPWFTGIKSSLKLYSSLITPKKEEMFSGSSLFHPRVFENAIADYLNSFFGHEKTNGKPYYRGPLNWKVLDISDTIKAAVMDIHDIGNTSKEHPKLRRLVFFPISDTHIVKLNFNFGGTIISGVDPVNPAPMLELADKILNTFQLEVGPKILANWNAVKALCPDMSLTQEFGELKWPINIEDIGKPQPLMDDIQLSKKPSKKEKPYYPRIDLYNDP